MRTTKGGQVSEGRWKTVNFGHNQLLAFVGRSHVFEEESEDGGPAVFITVKNKRTQVSIELTSMMPEELLYIKKFFTDMVDMMLPRVEDIDKKAREAFENGTDDASARLYRPLPQYITRERKPGQYDPSLPFRSSWTDQLVPREEPDGDDEPQGVRSPSEVLLERHEEFLGAIHSEKEGGLPEEFWQVPED